VRVLLQATPRPGDIEAKNHYKRTPLIEAAEYGRTEVVRVLLDNGANAGATCERGKNAMDYANDGGKHAIVALLEAFGGVWCDCGCLLLEGLDGLWNQIAAPSTGALPNQTEVAPHQTNGTSTTSTQANTQGRNGSGGRSSGWGGGCGGVSGGGDSQGSGGCKAEISVSASLTSSSSGGSGSGGSGGGGGKLAHFFLRSWGDSAWDDKDFVEVWFLAVGSPHHPVIAKWRAAFLEYWQVVVGFSHSSSSGSSFSFL
jgi:hypothetical protein